MEIQVTVNLGKETLGVLQSLGKNLVQMSGALETASASPSDATVRQSPRTPVKETKAAKENDGEALPEPTPTEKKEKKAASPKLEDVIKALQAYSAENGREDAAKLLAAFKVKSVKDLKAEQYADVIKKAKV